MRFLKWSAIVMMALFVFSSACNNVETIDPPASADTTAPGEVQSSQFIIYSIAPDPANGLETRVNIPAFMWVKPGDADLAGIRVVRKAGAEPQGPDDGSVVYDGTDSAFVDGLVAELAGDTFIYKIYTYDRAGNYSSGVVVNQGVILYLMASVVDAMMERDTELASGGSLLVARNVSASIAPGGPSFYFGESWINRAKNYLQNRTRQLVDATVSSIGGVMDVSAEVAKELYNDAKDLQDDICSNMDCKKVGITLFNYGSYGICTALGIPASPYITEEGHMGICVGMPGGSAMIFDLQDGSVEAQVDGVWVKLEDGDLDWGLGLDFGVAGLTFNTDTGAVNVRYLGNGFQVNCINNDGREITTNFIQNNGMEQVFTEMKVTVEGVSVANVNVSDYVSNSNSATAEVVDFSVVPNDNQEVVLAWKNPAARYEKSVLVRKTGGFPENASDGAVLLDGITEGFTDRTVAAGSVYFYKIFTWNGSQYSNGRGVSAAVRADIVPPVVGMDLTAEVHDRKLVLAWQNPADPDFAGVRLVRKSGEYPVDANDGDVVYEGTDESYSDEGLANNETYYYAAFFFDDMNNYSLGIYVDAMPMDLVAPGDAINFTARAAHDRVVLSWSNASDADLLGIRVVRKTGGYPSGIDDGDVIYDGTPKTGHTDTAVTFGQTYYYRVFSYDDDGNWSTGGAQQSVKVDYIRFMKTFGGSGADRGWSVEKTSDGGYVLLGQTTSSGAGSDDLWLIKVDCFGNIQWSRTYGGSGSDVASQSIQQTADGGYIILGKTYSYSGQSYIYDYDIWVIKTDSGGNEQWNRVIGTGSHDKAGRIRQTADGGFLLIGSLGAGSSPFDSVWLIKLNSVGSTVWTRTYGGNNVDNGFDFQFTDDGGYLLLGFTVSYAPSGVWLIKTDAGGNMEWQKFLGGNAQSYSLKATLDGGYIIAGGYDNGSNNQDMWLVKTSSLGVVEWSKSYGSSTGVDWAYCVESTSDGGYILTGRYPDSNGIRMAVIKTDANGNTVWDRFWPTISYGRYVIQANDGGYVITGDLNGDIVLIKTDPDGNTE